MWTNAGVKSCPEQGENRVGAASTYTVYPAQSVRNNRNSLFDIMFVLNVQV